MGAGIFGREIISYICTRVYKNGEVAQMVRAQDS